MKTYHKIFIPLLSAALLFSGGCKEDEIHESDISDEANRVYDLYVMPGTIKCSARDLIDEIGDGEFIVDDDSLILRQFQMPLSLEWDNLATFTSPSLNTTLYVPSGNEVGSFTLPMQMNPSDDVRLDQIDLNNGLINFNITVPSSISSGVLTISFPDVTTNGTIISKTFNITSSIHSFSQSILLQDAVITFDNTAHPVAPHNSNIRFVVSLSNLTSNNGGNLDINCSFSDLDAETVTGYFGQKSLVKNGNEYDFDIFDEYNLAEMVQFADLQIFVQGINPIGTPFRLDVSNVRFSQKDKPSSVTALTTDGDLLTFDLDAATKSDKSVIADTTNTVEINRDNSNIEDLLKLYPNYLTYDIKGLSNPNASSNTSKIVNFLNPNNRTVNANLMVNFPFWFSTVKSGYTRHDTIDFDIQDMMDLETAKSIELLELHLEFENYFPFDLTVQGEVLRENDESIDKLLNEDKTLIDAAPTNDNGITTSSSTSELIINIPNEKIVKFWNAAAKKIVFEQNMQTYNAPNINVKLLTTNYIKAKVTIKAKSKIPTN